MNMNQFTQKSLEAIQSAQNIAVQYGNQQIEQCHLLLSLVDQEHELIPLLLTQLCNSLPCIQAAFQAV